MSKFIKVRLGALGCLLLLAWTAMAQADILECDICGKPITENYRMMRKLEHGGYE